LLPPSPFSGHSFPVDSLWPKGVSANPGGAPKGKRLSTWLAEFGQIPSKDWPEEGSDRYENLPGNAQIALGQLRRARRTDDGLPAAMWAADRVEGGVDRTVHLTHKQEATMTPEEAAKLIKDAGLDGAGGQLEKF
jgi:hypothetical protein